MNFYKHHMGDYARDTAHLTWDEDMAYTRLLRAYYGREGPIPDADRYRLTRASTKREREAVDRVLAEFFKHDGNGHWKQKRADQEVTAYQLQAATNRRIAQQRTVNESLTNRSPETTTRREPNQNQIPEPEPEKSKTLSGNARLILAFLNEKTGRHYEPVAANLELIVARLKDGVSIDDLRAVVAKKVREWGGDEKMAPYLRPATLFNRTKFAQYQGELHREVS